MRVASVSHTDDLQYKGGYVQCACGWRKALGDGFNGYHIANCPECTPELQTQTQRKVTTGRPVGRNLTVQLGRFVYFVLSNGLHIQHSAAVTYTKSGLSEREADAL